MKEKIDKVKERKKKEAIALRGNLQKRKSFQKKIRKKKDIK